ncbi:UvrD-helicase domain-containing protein [uncultured Parasutterella sp.]|uniref:UvrD-helicase domain-containing protein n=1 Tax=uncultured Parasutterella sp. TaxID=1263098 RepID=UPI0025D2D669|nr:UvrD-helicase domain-containing protein [uncultured Parasutterella sp.]
MPSNEFDPAKTPIEGRMLLEASAGTGKTYSLMRVLLRLLVEEEEIELDRILVVTFTNAATDELSSRLRNNLTELIEQIRLNNGGSFKDLLDSWKEKKYSQDKILEKLQKALNKIDDAAIFTIHGFCQRILQDFVFSSKGNYDFEIGDDSNAKDKALSTFLRTNLPKVYPTCPTEQLSLARDIPWSEILTTAAGLSRTKPLTQQMKLMKDADQKPEDETNQFFYSFIDQATKLYEENKKEDRLYTFDDLLIEAEDRIVKDPEFTKAIQNLYDAALIDEFQDTDSIQYSIFKRLFLEDPKNSKPVIFVGDPKQSIYRFRNASLETYLLAKKEINNTYQLIKNFRSTPGIIAGVNEYFNPVGKSPRGGFLNPALTYSPVKANEKKLPLLIERNGKLEPLSSFAFWSNTDTSALSDADTLHNMEAIAIAEEIESLLRDMVFYEGRRLRPSDIAILVAKRSHADQVIEQLRKRGIRTLRSSNENVLCSKEAHELKSILEAMYDPRDTRLVAAAQATRIFGDSLNDLLNNDAASAQARLLLENSAKIYEKSGIIAAVSNLFAGAKTEERLLQYGGERALTNYQHILELLHQQHNTIDNLQGLLRWLKQEKENSNENYKLRRETDSDVVRVETIHSSKGLQYPVVYYLDRQITFSKKQKVRDDETGVITFYETEQKAPDDFVERTYEESMRLLYVAMTRATARVVLPYFFKKTKSGAPDGRNGCGGKNPLAQAICGESAGKMAIINGLNRLRDALKPNGLAATEVKKALLDGISDYNKDSSHPLTLSKEALDAYSPFDIRFDFDPDKFEDSKVSFREQPMHLDLRAGDGAKQYTSWTSSSFSSLLRTMEAQDSAVITDETEAPESEEPIVESKEEDILEVLKGSQSATEFGTKVHELLEKIFNKNFHDWKIRVYKFLDDRFKGYVVPDTEERKAEIETKTEKLFDELFSAKILPTAPEFELAQLFKNLKNCRPELEFMLSVGAPIKGRERLTASLLAETLAAFDSRYKDFHLSELDMRGYLTGSIDLAFAADGKYWVIDWKTNKIDYRNNAPELYTPEAVDALMKNNHYELQLALYLVALKRMLEVRLNLPEGTGYKAIGGAVYCFLRGIDRNARGTYFERPKDALIECLDDFLKNGFSRELLESRAKGALK